MRATIWLTAFAEAAKSGRSFIFTFHPEASVEPGLIDDLTAVVAAAGGRIFFVALVCSPATILNRLPNSDRCRFGKLTDPALYNEIEQSGGFEFPAMPPALVTIDTDTTSAPDAARKIMQAVALQTGTADFGTFKAAGEKNIGLKRESSPEPGSDQRPIDDTC